MHSKQSPVILKLTVDPYFHILTSSRATCLWRESRVGETRNMKYEISLNFPTNQIPRSFPSIKFRPFFLDQIKRTNSQTYLSLQRFIQPLLHQGFVFRGPLQFDSSLSIRYMCLCMYNFIIITAIQGSSISAILSYAPEYVIIENSNFCPFGSFSDCIDLKVSILNWN